MAQGLHDQASERTTTTNINGHFTEIVFELLRKWKVPMEKSLLHPTPANPIRSNYLSANLNIHHMTTNLPCNGRIFAFKTNFKLELVQQRSKLSTYSDWISNGHYYLHISDYLQPFCSRLIFIAEQKAGQLILYFLFYFFFSFRSQTTAAKKIVVHYFPTFSQHTHTRSNYAVDKLQRLDNTSEHLHNTCIEQYAGRWWSSSNSDRSF